MKANREIPKHTIYKNGVMARWKNKKIGIRDNDKNSGTVIIEFVKFSKEDMNNENPTCLYLKKRGRHFTALAISHEAMEELYYCIQLYARQVNIDRDDEVSDTTDDDQGTEAGK